MGTNYIILVFFRPHENRIHFFVVRIFQQCAITYYRIGKKKNSKPISCFLRVVVHRTHSRVRVHSSVYTYVCVSVISFRTQYIFRERNTTAPVTDRIRLSLLPDFGFRPQNTPSPDVRARPAHDRTLLYR